ncbi:MAG: SpoIIE family protein phosphatase, partial [Armatimonadetes bacterium]|nr:SpoIIE family protein phosphatase [Armatimonadota bacterium]
ALSYEGMPSFLGVPSPGKAAAYWMLSRLIVGVGLLGASLIRPPFKVRRLTPVLLLTAAAVIIGGFTAVATLMEPAFGNMFFDPVTKLTGLKIGLEILAMTLYAAAFVALADSRGWERRSASTLRAALLVAIFAEFAFTLYQSPYGYTNALGHVYKALAYYLILNALFVTAIEKPYTELREAKEELQGLYLHAQEHREEIERSFARIGSALSSSLELGEALDRIAELAVDVLHADCSVVVSLDKQHRAARVVSRSSGCEDVLNECGVMEQTSRMVSLERGMILIGDLRDTDLAGACRNPDGPCLRSMLCAPMIHENQMMGMVAVYSCSPNVFDAGDEKLIEGFGSHAAVAMHNAVSYQRESRIADVLQRTFLSTTTVVTERFEIAQVYEPAMNEALVGGDFYDVIEMPDQKIGLVIGDVSGKGLAAAVHTAMVKFSLRAYAAENHSPATVLQLIDRTLSSESGAETFVTMFFGVLDTNTGELVYASGGHEPPVYACNGTFLTLPPTGPAIGLGINHPFGEGRIVLEKGSTLLLYTDGISEARQGHTFLGIQGIGDELLACELKDTGSVARCVHEAAVNFAGGELRDDAAILAIRAVG